MTVGGPAHNNEVNRGSIFVKLKPRRERRLSQQQFETEIRKMLVRLHRLAGARAAGRRRRRRAGADRHQPERSRPGRAAAHLGPRAGGDPGRAGARGAALVARGPQAGVDRGRGPRPRLAGGPVASAQIGASLRPVLSGQKAGDWEDETGLSHDVIVRMAPEFREIEPGPPARSRGDEPGGLATGTPVMVPLGQVAQLRHGGAPAQIDRQKLERVATIEGNFQGRPLTDVTGDIQKRLNALELPPGLPVRLRRRAGRLRRDRRLHDRVADAGGGVPLHHPRQPVRLASSSLWPSCCRCRCRWSA